jgi:hypothetical protein
VGLVLGGVAVGSEATIAAISLLIFFDALE